SSSRMSMAPTAGGSAPLCAPSTSACTRRAAWDGGPMRPCPNSWGGTKRKWRRCCGPGKRPGQGAPGRLVPEENPARVGPPAAGAFGPGRITRLAFAIPVQGRIGRAAEREFDHGAEYVHQGILRTLGQGFQAAAIGFVQEAVDGFQGRKAPGGGLL